MRSRRHRLQVVFGRISPQPLRDSAPGILKARSGNTRRPFSGKSAEWFYPEPRPPVCIGQPGFIELAVPPEVGDVLFVQKSVLESGKIDHGHLGLALKQITIGSITQLADGIRITEPFSEQPLGLRQVVETAPGELCAWLRYRASGQIELATSTTGAPLYRRYVDSRLPEPTNLMTMVLRLIQGRLCLVTAYYGPPSARVPGTLGSTTEDRDWWINPKTGAGRAFVLDLDEVKARRVVGPKVMTCPW